MPLFRQQPIPDFPLTGYSSSNKRNWGPDGCWNYFSSGSAADATIGLMSLQPFYIRYDVPAGELEMKSSYVANPYGTSGRSNISQWGMYRVGTSLYDSTLVEYIQVSDNSIYYSPTKSQTLAQAYPKGWYIASIVPTSGNLNTTSATPQNGNVFGSLSTNNIKVDAALNYGFSGQTSGLPASLSGLSLTQITYTPPISLRY